MSNKLRKFNIILLLVLCIALVFAVPVQAKANKYKKLYKKFLAKGTYTVSSTWHELNSRTGKVYKSTSKSTFKIAKYAVANLDGKGEPELLLFSKQYIGKKPLNSNAYYMNVAYIKGNKVKFVPRDEWKHKIGKKTYKDLSYTIGVLLRSNQVKFYPAKSLLCIDGFAQYYEEDVKKLVCYPELRVYEFKKSLLKHMYDYEDENNEVFKGLKRSTAKVLTNNSKNRNKSF